MSGKRRSKQNVLKQEKHIDLISFINAFWKLKSKISKLNISDLEKRPLETYMNIIIDLFSKYGYEIIDYTGKKHNLGDNVDILCVEGEEGENFYVTECIQPTILFQKQIKQKASIIVTRGVK
jgi:hypothetical protein